MRLGLERAGHLLAAGERVIAGRLLELEGEAGLVYARLSARKPEVFRVVDLEVPGVEDLERALARLARLELVDALVPPRLQLESVSNTVLRDLCRRDGLRVSGRRAALLERLAGRGTGDRFVRIRHRGLVLRLSRWATLRRRPDRSRFVLERLGVQRWPEYERTTGSGLHEDRRTLRRWEQLVAALDELDAPALVEALADPASRGPGRLDLRPALLRRLEGRARLLERSRALDEAAAVYAGALVAVPSAVGAALRLARIEERRGRPDDALRVLSALRGRVDGPQRRAIERAGRRVSRQLGRGWAPDRPWREALRRDLRLEPAGETNGNRPLWRVDDRPRTVESAVVTLLAAAGRPVLRGEGPLYATLVACLLADLYFLGVPGALPARFLAGPLDLGTHRFAANRAAEVRSLLARVRGGDGPRVIARNDAKYRGVRLAGAHWERVSARALRSAADAVGAAVLARFLEVFLERGWSASAGIPDLLVLPGPTAVLGGAHPATVGEGACFVEVKGPGDVLRDEQAWWIDQLLGVGSAVEVWRVEPIRRS